MRPASVHAYTSHALLALALSGFGFLIELLNDGFSFQGRSRDLNEVYVSFKLF